ncbi:hemerythrin domain-containing protein [Leekyejoonella antrihumi]|uniref:Hemerythrin domain-containing protein n=1 Tax=Leekyejoonella antrihumi TaxID=1660198 RepID=A0A563E4I4_9MICO|nr:hemerythrin domain-containing protein [Leekyejoonella antrihumi]TWP37437.1 hemerythrin domain-containing protein [Leekyejoonella antrihumi]
MDITEVILHQHAEQRRMFAMLDEVDRLDTATLQPLWRRLEILLETHAAAEEKFLYPLLPKVGAGHADADAADEEVQDAVKDHNEIRAAIGKVGRHQVGSTAWWDAVTETRVANSDHMAEEERQDLADFRRHTDLQTRHEIAVEFVRFESEKAAEGVPPTDKDPDEYVEERTWTGAKAKGSPHRGPHDVGGFQRTYLGP